MCLLQARMDRTDIGTLLIPNIRLSDAGTYMCVGSNSVGSNSAPIKVTVHKGETSNRVSQETHRFLLLCFIVFLSWLVKLILKQCNWELHKHKH